MMAASVTMGQISQQLDTIANNLSNVETTGYKSRDANFEDLLFQQINNAGKNEDKATRLTPNGIRLGSGAKIGDTQLDMSLGTISQTGRSLDLALSSPEQFFEIGVAGANGQYETEYTRDGAFQLSPDKQNPNLVNLVTDDGNAVLDASGNPIQIPAHAKDIQINKQGGVIVAVMQNGSRQTAGRLGLVQALRPQLLESKGNNLFGLPNLGTGVNLNNVMQAVGAGNASVQQGELEGSNVDMTKQMTELINLQHAYQLNGQAITLNDQMAGLVNSLIR
ncbi:flagellar hook-basal body protein [Terrilactibacillus sp. S3-3]|nr:flagellar hook-basal body protein [Terrilactibacillus sp. S3-3]